MSKVRYTLKYSCEFPLTIYVYLAPDVKQAGYCNNGPAKITPGNINC